MNDAKKWQALLVIVTGFIVLYYFLEYKWLMYAAVLVGVLSILIPAIGDGIVWAWFKLAQGLGWINSRILLTLVFYIFLFPLALLYRLFSNDTLRLKRQEDSVYRVRNHKYEKKDLENLW